MSGPELLHESVRRHLQRLGIGFEVMECDPELADTAAFVEAYGVPADRSANTIVVASRGSEPIYVACIVLATTSLDVNRVVRREMGVRKASFAGADAVRDLTGMEIGGVTPFGLPEDLPILVDSRVMEPDWVVLGGGNRSSKLRVAPGVMGSLPSMRIVEGLAFER
jgi:prolyl-tRNA editing enzyme YbaK/EbsC (Cys-tRNA(Pro) deacylase)